MFVRKAMTQLPAINLGELTKPATVLIEKISDAIGGMAKPWQIERVAKAEAQAAFIKANTDIEIDDLKRRALIRLVNEEAKRQENIESIIAHAIPYLAEGSDPSKMDDDWIEHLFSRARHVSSNDMQRYWAKLLAEEANHPGDFSKHTINVLSSITSREALIFKRLSVCFFEIENDREESREKSPFVTSVCLEDTSSIYVKKFGFTYDDIVSLESLSLLRMGDDEAYCFTYEQEKPEVNVKYREKSAVIRTDPEYDIVTGSIILTRWGEEMSKLFEWETSYERWSEIEAYLRRRERTEIVVE